MGITSSLITGLSGLTSNQSQLDVIGNNIANVNTVGFKSSRMDFKTQFSENFSLGSAPNNGLGGTNPLQIGLGVVQGAVSRDFNDGSREVTGVTSDMAIEGPGFFVLQDNSGQSYTRDGTFQLNSLNELVNSDGQHVQGFGVDSNFNVIPGVLQNITIPLNALTVADATTKASLEGNLNANGALPTQVSDLTMNQAFFTSDGAGGVTGTAPTSATLLSQVADASGNLYFQPGDTLSMTGMVGLNTAAAKTLAVTGTTTLGDLQSFMAGTLGINTSAGANGPIATTPGVSLGAGPAGAAVLTVDGNPGTANDLTLDANSLTINRAGTTSLPFTWNKNAAADGESGTTSFGAFDSLGNPVTVNLTATLVGKTSTGTTWQFYATSPDSAATNALTQTVVGAGTLTFDTNGKLVSATNPSVNIDRSGTGATPNLSINLDFSSMSAMASTGSSFNPGVVDGTKIGNLTSYAIDASGIISGKFSNGSTRTLGQVALATFRNDQGLIDNGNNTWQTGPNSGTAVITAPGNSASGQIVSGTLELSNVDLSAEFVQLISASTGFSASSRVITTANQLLQELLSAAR